MWSPTPELAPHADALRRSVGTDSLGIYLHAPFCQSRCSYCSFVRTEDRTLLETFSIRLRYALASWGEHLGRPRVDTLYVGGGTPSLLRSSDLKAIMGTLSAAFDLSPLEEATLEANPGTTSLEWLEAARALGWNRVSFGVQSLDPGLLSTLGRTHTPRDALRALDLAQEAGFRRISADLLLGIPGQDLAQVLGDATALVERGADHLAVYMLDLDKDSALARAIARGAAELPPEEAVAEAYEALHGHLEDLGLQGYEISNFARPGQESRHNTRYWRRRPYLGLGPSAASQMAHLRWTQTDDIQAWLAGSGSVTVEGLEPDEVLAETALLGLRMSEGIAWGNLRRRAEELGLADLWSRWDTELEPCRKAGLVREEEGRLRLTLRGMLMSNRVFQIFV